MGYPLALLFFLQTPMIYAQTLDKMDFKFGDFLKYSVVGKEKGLYWPYHYMVALSNEELMDIRRDEASELWCHPRIISKRKVPEGLKYHIFEKEEADTPPQIGREKTLALAMRMAGLKLPYDMYSCNCKHYSYYVMYGRTYSKWFSASYRSRGGSCPLAHRVTKAVDVTRPEFQLKDGYGQTYPLNKLSREELAIIKNPDSGSIISANAPPTNTAQKGRNPRTTSTKGQTSAPTQVPRQGRNSPPRTLGRGQSFDSGYSTSDSFNYSGGVPRVGQGSGRTGFTPPASQGQGYGYRPSLQQTTRLNSGIQNSGFSFNQANARANDADYARNEAYRNWVDSKSSTQGRRYC